MFIQCIVLIATMLVLAAAILTGALVSVKTVLHQTMLSRTQTAMTDATARFIADEQKFVQSYGTEQQETPLAQPITEPICTGGANAGVGASQSSCPYLATMNWVVTGRTIGASGPGASGSPADARYLANTVDEQRISVTIAVQVSNLTGMTVYGERSRELTARIFDAPPYVVITGTRDAGSDAGGFRQAQGDTGGASASAIDLQFGNHPTTALPAAYTDTKIKTTILCENSKAISGESPIGKGYYDPRFHPYGNHVWTYESSCASGEFAIEGAPPDYVPSAATTFTAEAQDPETAWHTNDENQAAFPR